MTDAIGINATPQELRPSNDGHLRLALEIAVTSGFIRMSEEGYDLEGWKRLPVAARNGALIIAAQYMAILAGSMMEAGVVNEKNSAWKYLMVDGPDDGE